MRIGRNVIFMRNLIMPQIAYKTKRIPGNTGNAVATNRNSLRNRPTFTAA